MSKYRVRVSINENGESRYVPQERRSFPLSFLWKGLSKYNDWFFASEYDTAAKAWDHIEEIKKEARSKKYNNVGVLTGRGPTDGEEEKEPWKESDYYRIRVVKSLLEGSLYSPQRKYFHHSFSGFSFHTWDTWDNICDDEFIKTHYPEGGIPLKATYTILVDAEKVLRFAIDCRSPDFIEPTPTTKDD